MDIDTKCNANCIYTTIPTYLKPFFLHREKEIVLIYYKRPSISETTPIEEKPFIKSDGSSDLDLTGDPLKVDLGSDETFLCGNAEDQFNPWSNDEDRHYPFSIEIARAEVASCLQNQNSHTNRLICCICNGQDDQHTVFLFGQKTNEYFRTAAIYMLGMGMANSDSLTLENIQKSHLRKIRNKKIKIDYLVNMKYQLYGTHLNSPLRSEHHGSIEILITTNKFVYDVPQTDSQISMNLQISAGHHNSVLNFLWEDLSLLQTYLDCLNSDQFSKNESQFLHDDSIDQSEIYNNIRDMISKNLLKRSIKEKFDLNNLRDDTFLDRLWRILKMCTSSERLRDAFHYFFEEIVSTGSLWVEDDGSHVSSLISRIIDGKMIISSITLPQAIELIFDLGAQKLQRDFITIIKEFNPTFLEIVNTTWNSLKVSEKVVQDIRRTRVTENLKTSQTSIRLAREKLAYLGQLYVAVDFIFLVKNEVNLVEQSFDNFCEAVLKSYVTVNNNLNDFKQLQERPLCNFTCQLNWVDVNIIEGRDPIQWTAHLKSKGKNSQYSTIYHMSKKIIIPPGIYNDYEVPENNDIYYVAKMVEHKEYI